MIENWLINMEHGQDPKGLLIALGIILISIILCLINYLFKKINNKKLKVT